MTLHCMNERMDVEPAYNYREHTYDQDAPLWHSTCAAACVDEAARHKAFPGNSWGGCSSHSTWGCPMSECFIRTAQAPCTRELDHDGPCDFSDDSVIVFEFPVAVMP